MNAEAFILAGGRSIRFGSDKALMKVGGRSVIETIAGVVNDALPDANIRVVASGNAQVLSWPFSFPTVFDLYPGRGPWSGLHAALAYGQSEWILALACDYPFLSSELIEFLYSETSDEIDAVVPIQEDGRLQPLCSFYRREACLPLVESVVTSNRPTPPLRTIFEDIRTCQVPFEGLSGLRGYESFFTNINSPQDLSPIDEHDLHPAP